MADKPTSAPERWRTEIVYRTLDGIVDVEFFHDELFELQDIVENGPDWRAIVNIVTVLNRPTAASRTIEQQGD